MRFDIIHAHFVFPNATWGIIGKLFRIPVMVTSHGWDIQKNKHIGYGARLNKIYAMLTWLTLKLVDAHVVVSRSMIKDAIEAGTTPSKIRVIYNGIDLKKIQHVEETDVLKQYKITDNDLIILYLGRLHPKKCPSDLVIAFPKVIQKVPNAKLIIAGEGSEKEKLEKLVTDLKIEKKVIFTGFISDSKKWVLLKSCDIFVLPSLVEAFGISVIEAMACGKPVIVTDIGTFTEIVRNGENGLIVPARSPNELANAIIELALDKDKRKKIGETAREDVKKRFDINYIAEKYLRLYQDLINNNKKLLKINKNIHYF